MKKLSIMLMAACALGFTACEDDESKAIPQSNPQETIMEAAGLVVAQGAAIEAGVTILAHPGLITEEDARLAAEKGVYLEITSKKGHSLTNGHVYKIAKKVGAEMVLDSDSHSDSDFLSPEYAEAVLAGCGMDEKDIQTVLSNNCKLLDKLINK